jgi:hypothetical protein
MASYMDNTESDPYNYVDYKTSSSSSTSSAAPNQDEESPYAEPVLIHSSRSTSGIHTPSLTQKSYEEGVSPGTRSNSEISNGSGRYLSSGSGCFAGESEQEVKENNTGGFRPSEVLKIKRALKKKPCTIDETSCSFWCRNFPECQITYDIGDDNNGTSSNTDNPSDHTCTSTQNFEHYANHETPKTELVIRAFIREYQTTDNCEFPMKSSGCRDERFVDALACALDPSGCGQVYPEYYFAMVATFGPFEVILKKLTYSVFYHPNPDNETTNDQLYFHGFASRSQCVKILENHCGGNSESLTPGLFVLRFSTSQPGQLTISWINAKKEIKHTALKNKKKNGFEPQIMKGVGGNKSDGLDGKFVNIGDLLQHHGNFFVTPCSCSNTLKTYNDIKEEMLEKWHQEEQQAEKGGGDGVACDNSSVYVAVDDVYGVVLVQ